MGVGGIAAGMLFANIGSLLLSDLVETNMQNLLSSSNPDHPYKDEATIATETAALQESAAETNYQMDGSFLNGSGGFVDNINLSNDESDSIAETNRKEIMREYLAGDKALVDQQGEEKSSLNVSASGSGFKVSSGTYEAQRQKIDSDYAYERNRIKQNTIGAIQNLEKSSNLSYEQGMFNADLTMQNYYQGVTDEALADMNAFFDVASGPFNFLAGQGFFEDLF